MTPAAVPPQAVLSRAADVLAAASDGELVMMRLDTDLYYGLDPVGRRVWELLEEPATAGELCDRLRQEFEVEPEQCAAELLPFLGELAAEGIILVDRRF